MKKYLCLVSVYSLVILTCVLQFKYHFSAQGENSLQKLHAELIAVQDDFMFVAAKS